MPGSTTVQIELSEEPDGTLLVLTHREISTDEASLQKMGWTHYLLRLALVAAGDDPGPDLGPGG